MRNLRMTYMNRYQSMGAIADVASAAANVAADPCLTQVATLVRRLHDLEQAPPVLRLPGTPVPTAPPPPPVKGIGLCSAVGPLKAVVYVRERPWVLPLAGIGIVGGLIGIGYLIGRRGRR